MKIYIMGICGTAMAHVALLLKEMGHVVVGSDSQFIDPIAHLLKKNAIETHVGFDVQRLKNIRPDCVIIGNVVSRGNLEAEYLLNTQAIPFYSFPEFLKKHVFPGRPVYVVSGTHGKTTATSLLAYLLCQCDRPGYLIGGLPNNFESGCTLGDKKAPFVIEGDEYDTAFFDKRSKFLHYWPHTLIINNIEFDHADIFRDLTDIQRSFYQLTRLLPGKGHLIINGEDAHVKALLPCPWTQVHSVGFSKENEWLIEGFGEDDKGLYFDLCHNNQCVFSNVQVPLFGAFNARNVAMALVAAFVNGYQNLPIESLKQFAGVRRRQARLYQSENLTIFEDFAHHPSAVQYTLEALKQRYPNYYRIACFEPACNTSASYYFAERALPAFESAHEVWLLPAKATLYCDKFLNPLTPINLSALKKSLENVGKKVHVYASLESFENHFDHWKPTQPTLLCCLSNGKLSASLTRIINNLPSQ